MVVKQVASDQRASASVVVKQVASVVLGRLVVFVLLAATSPASSSVRSAAARAPSPDLQCAPQVLASHGALGPYGSPPLGVCLCPGTAPTCLRVPQKWFLVYFCDFLILVDDIGGPYLVH